MTLLVIFGVGMMLYSCKNSGLQCVNESSFSLQTTKKKNTGQVILFKVCDTKKIIILSHNSF